jgi:hypothetical protein
MVSFLKVMVFKATVSECHRARLVSSPVSSPDYFVVYLLAGMLLRKINILSKI